MRPPLAAVDWPRSVRIVPSRYPAVGLFDRVASQEDLDAVHEIGGLTNDRLRNALGAIDLVPPGERIFGAGTTPIMAAFTHPNREGSRPMSPETSIPAWMKRKMLSTRMNTSCLASSRKYSAMVSAA